MISTNPCSFAEFSTVKFTVLGDESIRSLSNVAIISDYLNKEEGPYPGGIYDPHLGTLDNAYRCATCNNVKSNCLGHSGHMTLNYPIWNPLFVNEGIKWLRIICHNPQCHKPIFSFATIQKYPISQRFTIISDMSKNGNKKCHHCQEQHYIIKRDKQHPAVIISEKYVDKKQVDSKRLYPLDIKKILSAITDDIILLFGKSLDCHPKNTIISEILVPTVNIRPETRRAQLRSVTTDELTVTLQIINKKTNTLPVVIDTITPKLDKIINDTSILFNEYVKATKEGSMNSLTKRLKGKQGHFRQNILGKRVFKMCRSTIVGDYSLEIDEIAIPLMFARTVKICDVVQDYNRAKLLEYINNGNDKYPGASTIVKKSTGKRYNVNMFKENIENGDIVYRDIVDGDVIGFNRQPSLAISSIGSHRVKVTLDPEIKVIRMNVLACPLYGADFDGDQMNLIVYSSAAARSEVNLLSNVKNWMISHTTSNPTLGQVDDSIIGLAELTRSNVRLDKYHAMLLFGRTTKLPSFGTIGTKHITGRDCVSVVLDGMNINFTKVPSWFNSNYAHIIKYDKDDIEVVIENGKHIKGILDKASIGKGARGGLYDIICREYGSAQALKTIYDMQQIAIAYNIYVNGYSMGIMDMIIPKDFKTEIDKIASDMINKSQLITNEFIRGEMVPPIGETVYSFCEKSQINELSSFGMFDETILRAINHYTNNLYKLMAFGSKGSLNNFYNINAVIGQRLINGERVQEKFGLGRTLPYFPRFDTDPVARGYSPNSYLSGMSPAEYIWGSMGARFDMISKQLSTATTGEMERQSIKSLETIVVSNLLQSLKFDRIIQFMCGDDGMDVRYVENITFPTVMISDDDFEKKYNHKDYPQFFSQMSEDRDKYRRIYLKIETTTTNEIMTNSRRLPVNVNRIIKDTCIANKSALADIKKSELDNIVRMVTEFCEDMPYLYVNPIQCKLRLKLPAHIYDSVWLMQMLVRSYLCPSMIVANKLTQPLIETIIEKISTKFIRAIVSPGTPIGIITGQCFSEPLVQYMLDSHHRSASGGTSKKGMKQGKEILNAKPTKKLENPQMFIPVRPEFVKDKQKVQEIANNIEQMTFDRFVTEFMIFYEPFGKPVHPSYAHESKIINEFIKLNPLLQPPGDLINWCIRFELDRTTLILKNMTVQYIVNKLRDAYPNIYIVYTSDNAKVVLMRVYMRNNMFKGDINTDILVDKGDMLLQTTIRGITKIINTSVIEIIRNRVNTDNSIEQDTGNYGIITSGTNLAEMFNNPYINALGVQTESIIETANVLGIEAARIKLIQQLKGLVNVCNYKHYMLYADEMTHTGRVTGMTLSGLVERENNPLLHMGFSSPIVSLESAIANSKTNVIGGVTAKFMVGTVPSFGTFYNQLQVNQDVILANTKKVSNAVDDLFDN